MSARKTNLHLPKAMYFKHGRYWLVTARLSPSIDGTRKQRWMPLPKALDAALREYQRLISLDPSQLQVEMASRDALVHHGQQLFRKAKQNAAARNISFFLEPDSVVAIGEMQDWKCALTGLQFSLETNQVSVLRYYQ